MKDGDGEEEEAAEEKRSKKGEREKGETGNLLIVVSQTRFGAKNNAIRNKRFEPFIFRAITCKREKIKRENSFSALKI